jgi:hypothetical protein
LTGVPMVVSLVQRLLDGHVLLRCVHDNGGFV